MPQPPDGLIHETDTEMMRLMNLARAGQAVQPLQSHPALLQAARQHAEDMASHKQLSHFGLDQRSTWADRCRQAGYPGASLLTVDEIVGAGAEDESTMIADYHQSSGHWHRIVDPRWVHAATAVARGSNGVNYWVTDFGKPEE